MSVEVRAGRPTVPSVPQSKRPTVLVYPTGKLIAKYSLSHGIRCNSDFRVAESHTLHPKESGAATSWVTNENSIPQKF